MPNRPRVFAPGVSLHVRQRGNNHCAIFGDDRDHEEFLAMLPSAIQRYQVAVHGFSLMTTHTHLLLTPATEHGTSKAMQQLGICYVMYFNHKYNRVGTLWTGRYRAKPINDERYWLTCLRYIEQNPVRASMVVRPDQYRWSSYRAHTSASDVDWLSTHPVLEALGANIDQRREAYRAICDEPLSNEQLVRQRRNDQGQTRVRP
jgi:putative transposase